MDRQQYLQMRRTSQYNLDWFYQYYLKHKKQDSPALPFEIFQQVFQMYYQMNGSEILQNLDKKLDTTKIEDSNSNILYIN